MNQAKINYSDPAMRETLVKASREIGIELGEREISLFLAYGNELLFWNERMNLVSLKTPADLIIKHFVDSLTAAESIAKKDGTLLDVVAGAGFPGMPLKIVFDSLRVGLLEASRKKSSFLKNAVRTLGMQGVEVINARAEQLIAGPQYRGAYDTVISRATFKLADYLKVASGFLAPGGSLIAMKGPAVEAETAAARPILKELGLKPPECREIRLPVYGDLRKIIIFKKT